MAANASADSDDIITGINVTPLVDIILVLLIIFMLTASIIANPSIEVKLPKAATGEGTPPTTLGLVLNAVGEIYVNGRLTDVAGLRSYLPTVVQENPDIQAMIAADAEVQHGRVIALIDIIRQHGIRKFALNVESAPSADVNP